jgi:hypothetical protein
MRVRKRLQVVGQRRRKRERVAVRTRKSRGWSHGVWLLIGMRGGVGGWRTRRRQRRR